VSTYSETMPHILGRELPDFETVVVEPELAAVEPLGHPNAFAQEQIRGLVRRVFSPGWPKPARQVVIAGVDEDGDVGDICSHIGEHLARQVQASVCVAEAVAAVSSREPGGDPPSSRVAFRADFGSFRKCSRQLSGNLWQVPAEVCAPPGGCSAQWLKGRLAELRLEFDYAVIHCPPASLWGEACLFGQMSDGVVLVIEGNSTRRVVAQKVKENLQAASARLLGVILNGRKFPIPQGIYDRL